MFLYIFVRPFTSSDLTGQHFLQRVRGAVGLECPHFHLAEALAAELRLATQRLLRDERVRTGRTRVHLVVDQVVELQHVHVADRDLALEFLAGAAVEQVHLAGQRQIRELEQALDLGFGGAVEHGVAIGTPFDRFFASEIDSASLKELRSSFWPPSWL
jgi:hypothetical protein